jgi:hypothetical protein
MNPLEPLAAIAESQCDLAESPRGSNRGAALTKFFAADDYHPGGKDEGYPWCACFVSWCVQQFLRKASTHFAGVTPPRLAAAFDFKAWGAAHHAMIFTPLACRPGQLWPQRGDIVVFKFSHVGIVAAVNGRDRIFTSIEGNSNADGGRDGYAVVRHGRTFTPVREFIRLTPKALPA